MTQLAPTPTTKGQLPKGKRKAIPIRLMPEHHAELYQTAQDEQRSMGFVALRRYLVGLRIEQNQSN